ncbi:MAG: hypothetical protein [Anelloviridae sp.]|nr:MAG: hypothetical protein [Anelloviridae sp.]
MRRNKLKACKLHLEVSIYYKLNLNKHPPHSQIRRRSRGLRPLQPPGGAKPPLQPPLLIFITETTKLELPTTNSHMLINFLKPTLLP